MKYVKNISLILFWLSLYLPRAAVQNPETGEEQPGNHGNRKSLATLAICNWDDVYMINNCAKDLHPLIMNGFPWGVANGNDIQNQRRNERQLKNTINDPLDPVNYVCRVFEDFLRCTDERSIPNVCLLTGTGQIFRIHTIFNFLCYKEPRSIDLLHNLRCLQQTRVVDLMVFQLSDIYGTSLIDIQAQGTTKALFRFLDFAPLTPAYYVNPIGLYKLANLGMICFPESVITHYIPFIVNRKCGSQAAVLVRSYYLHFRAHFNDLLDELGVPTNICHRKIHKNLTTVDGARMEPENFADDPLLRLFEQFIEDKSPGTAMDTVYGRHLRRVIEEASASELCNPVSGLLASFQACVLLSYDASGKEIFNVLQYAHSMTMPYTDFPETSSMETLSACWNLLQQICGANSTYVEYSYRVSAGSRQIQEMMNNVTCKWQDMLIGHYIAASEDGNIWPSGYNIPQRPMFLSRGIHTLGDFQNSLSDLSVALDAGIKEISSKCSKASATRIRLFYHRLKYFLYDVLKLQDMIAMSMSPFNSHSSLFNHL